MPGAGGPDAIAGGGGVGYSGPFPKHVTPDLAPPLPENPVGSTCPSHQGDFNAIVPFVIPAANLNVATNGFPMQIRGKSIALSCINKNLADAPIISVHFTPKPAMQTIDVDGAGTTLQLPAGYIVDLFNCGGNATLTFECEFETFYLSWANRGGSTKGDLSVKVSDAGASLRQVFFSKAPAAAGSVIEHSTIDGTIMNCFTTGGGLANGVFTASVGFQLGKAITIDRVWACYGPSKLGTPTVRGSSLVVTLLNNGTANAAIVVTSSDVNNNTIVADQNPICILFTYFPPLIQL